MNDRVVQRAVWLHVTYLGSAGVCTRSQRPDLIDDVGAQFFRGDVDEPPTETCQVPIADLGPDSDAVCSGAGAATQHDRRVAGVETTRYIGAGHDVEQRFVVAERPPPESFPEIGVEINAHGRFLHRAMIVRSG